MSEDFKYMPKHKIILGQDNKLIDRNQMLVFSLNDYELTTEQIETAKVLIGDGWSGTLNELIECAKGLDK